jgi:hypothetical protein
MDQFTERDLIENLKSIALSLRNIDRKLDELIDVVREANADVLVDEEDIDENEEPIEGLADPTIKFEISDEDSIEDEKFEGEF